MIKTGSILLRTAAFLLLCIPIAANFENEVLEEHNAKRKVHGCPGLELDDELSKECQEYAKTISEKGKLEHSESNGEYGENLYMGFMMQGGKSCVRSWYNEYPLYDFDKAEFSPSAGHFTQVVWKATKKLGVGRHRSGALDWVVARYKPAGNVAGQFKDNVPRRTLQDDDGASQLTLASNMIIFSWVFQVLVLFIFRSNL